MTVTSVDQVLVETAVRRLVQDWFEALDRHDHVDQLCQFLSNAGLVMHLPQRALRSHDDFRTWYDEVVTTFFDEVHEVTELDIQLTSPLHAEAMLRVNWQSRVWQPPAANSRWLGFDFEESWSVVLQDGMPKIRTYIIRGVNPMPGSASLWATD